jgi:nitrogen fixation/metabolism regulation signal transduction histidine kinase
MISKYRNRSIALIILASFLTALLVYRIATARLHIPSASDDNRAAIAFLLYLACWIAWFMASLSLAKAKGHQADRLAPVLVVLLILSICVPGLCVVAPIVVIFGLEDKTKRRR